MQPSCAHQPSKNEVRLSDTTPENRTIRQPKALAWRTVSPCTLREMIVRSFRHRGLRQLFETNSSRLLKRDLVERVRGILAALAMAENMEGFIRQAAPGWRVRRLSGARRNE